jgi:capsular exopolysaccharide synthesis family protein
MNDLSNPPGDDALPLPAAPDGQALSREVRATPGQALALELKGNGEPPADDEIDLLSYWRVIVKRRWMVLSVAASVLLLAAMITLLTTPMFRAVATLQIERDTIQVVQVEGLQPVESPAERDFHQTQYELLQSRSLAGRVIGDLGLLQDPVFLESQKPSGLAALLRLVTAAGVPADETPAARAAREQSEAVDWFLRHLSVEPVRNSRLVHIAFESPDPEFSARVINATAEAFIAANLERRMDASSYARDFLETGLADMKARLEDSERRLVAFAVEEQLVDLEGAGSLAAQQLGEINTALATAQDQRIRAEARWRQAEAAGGLGVPEVLASQVIQNLQETRARLMAEYQEKLGVFQPGFPEMRQLQGRIDEVERQLESEARTIKASLESEFRAAQANENLLRERIAALRAEVLDVRGRSIQYDILKREVDTNRQQYDALLQRYKEVGLVGGIGINNISVVDRAEVPRDADSPRTLLNLAIGLLLGLALGVLLALLVEYLDDTVKTPDDVERLFGLPVLGVIPKLKDDMTPEEAGLDVRSAFAEAHRSLRTALQFTTDRGVPKTVLVTSANMGEGKSTTSLSLARAFAQLGKSVLLMDCDLRNPSLHKRVPEASNAQGLSNFLTGAIKPAELVQATPIENLSFSACGPLPPNPAELLAGARMGALLTIAAAKHDIVMMDGPPIMGLADAPILSHVAAGTVLVIEAGRTRVGMVSAAIKRLAAARARVLGVVITKYDAKKAGYGYGYGYGYGEDYYAYGSRPKKLGRG